MFHSTVVKCENNNVNWMKEGQWTSNDTEGSLGVFPDGLKIGLHQLKYSNIKVFD